MIAITGAAGFIGSNLAHRLCKDGHELLLVDHPLTAAKAMNFAGLKRFAFVEHDLFLQQLEENKWQPEAIWALTGQSMATRGHMVRMGYGHLEQSFLTWEWEPHGAEQAEWIGIAERRHLEFSIAEMASTEAKYPLSQAR